MFFTAISDEKRSFVDFRLQGAYALPCGCRAPHVIRYKALKAPSSLLLRMRRQEGPFLRFNATKFKYPIYL
jgi:hypothetical protein